MNSFRMIRERLGMTQAEIADCIERTQGNVSLYEGGQTVPPDVAKRLIEACRLRGVVITYDDIYSTPEA